MVKIQPGDWLPVSECAKLLHLTIGRVHAIIKDGRLKPTRVGNQYLLLRADVMAFKKLPRVPGRPKAEGKPVKKPKGGAGKK